MDMQELLGVAVLVLAFVISWGLVIWGFRVFFRRLRRSQVESISNRNRQQLIQFPCPSCGRTIKVKAESAGKTGVMMPEVVSWGKKSSAFYPECL